MRKMNKKGIWQLLIPLLSLWWIWLLAGGIIILILGLIDDVVNVSPKVKIIVEFFV